MSSLVSGLAAALLELQGWAPATGLGEALRAHTALNDATSITRLADLDIERPGLHDAFVAIAGASGRMGRMLIEAVRASDDCSVTGALDLPTSPAVGQDAAAYLGQTTGALITGDHLVYTSGRHGSSYVELAMVTREGKMVR